MSSLLRVADAVLLCAALAIIYRLCLRQAQPSRLPYPPGPPGYPLIGHLSGPEGPGGRSWVTFRDWGLQYGSDVIHLNMAGTHLIVLNTLRACSNLLEKRSTIYSDRPTAGITMLSELCGLGWSFGLQRYGPEWRDGRKCFESQFNAHAVRKYRPALSREVSRFLRNLCTDPAAWEYHVHHMAGALIMSVGYAIDVQAKDDPYLNAAEHAGECVQKTLVPGAFLVDILPFLKYLPDWFPGAGFKQKARSWRKSIMYIRDAPYDVTKKRVADDAESVPDCVAKDLMEKMVDNAKDPEYMERVARSAVGSMYLAGADTTHSVLSACVLTLVLNPNFLPRAQASIDEVCQGRLPDFSDYEALPHVHAVVREAMRWNPVVALNLPHRCTTDDIYEGQLIPAGSIVIANIWAILHDPAVYPDPESCNPMRYLRCSPDGTVTLDPAVPNPADVAFGFGRRICPGRFKGYQTVWLALARMLAAFDI
uniref:Cytochrome P450 n=1 Tax=Phanerodontia chrysosporium TaxID=2822231 RepID=G5EJX1_PHACH|nr:cytochrome P450 [Phanerodontia chrysosporium]